MSTQEIRDIYKKVEIQQRQVQERLVKEKNQTLENRLARVFAKYFELIQNPKVSLAMQEEAKRDMDKTLDIIRMDSDHDVIMALTNNLITKKYKEKLRLELEVTV